MKHPPQRSDFQHSLLDDEILAELKNVCNKEGLHERSRELGKVVPFFEALSAHIEDDIKVDPEEFTIALKCWQKTLCAKSIYAATANRVCSLIKPVLDRPREVTLIDIGCGCGGLSQTIISKIHKLGYNTTPNVIGIDASVGALAEFEKSLSKIINNRVSTYLIDIESRPWGPSQLSMPCNSNALVVAYSACVFHEISSIGKSLAGGAISSVADYFVWSELESSHSRHQMASIRLIENAVPFFHDLFDLALNSNSAPEEIAAFLNQIVFPEFLDVVLSPPEIRKNNHILFNEASLDEFCSGINEISRSKFSAGLSRTGFVIAGSC